MPHPIPPYGPLGRHCPVPGSLCSVQFHLETDMAGNESEPRIEPVRIKPVGVGHQLHQCRALGPGLPDRVGEHAHAFK